MALRIKLRPWKNRIKKIHKNAKELSLLGGWIKREIEGEMREREGGRGGERYMYDNHDNTTPTCRHSKFVGTSRTDWLVQTAQGRE